MINQLVRKARKMFKTAVSAKNVRNDYYYNRIYFNKMLLFFKTINDGVKSNEYKKTVFEISPLGLKFGSNVSAVKKILGKEKYEYDNDNQQVLFYRRTFADISLLVQLQFYNNQLYFIGLDVIRRMIDEDEKTGIINTVIEKYLNHPYEKGAGYPLIRDTNNNFIIIKDDITFSICYMAGDVNIEKQKKIITSMEKILQEKPENGSLFYAF